jgi:hypothetical protein
MSLASSVIQRLEDDMTARTSSASSAQLVLPASIDISSSASQQQRQHMKLARLSRGVMAMNRLRNFLKREPSIQDIVSEMKKDRESGVNCHGDNTHDESTTGSTTNIALSSSDTLSSNAISLYDENRMAESDEEKDDTLVSSTNENGDTPVMTAANVMITEAAVAAAPSRTKQTVKWGTVQFRTYEIILGDNPSVSSGPPIGLGWRYVNDSDMEPPEDDCEDNDGAATPARTKTGSTMSMDEYEEIRIPQRHTIDQLVLSTWEREQRLMDVGYARSDLNKAITSVTQIKVSRQMNAQLGFFEKGGFATLIQNQRKNNNDNSTKKKRLMFI